MVEETEVEVDTVEVAAAAGTQGSVVAEVEVEEITEEEVVVTSEVEEAAEGIFEAGVEVEVVLGNREGTWHTRCLFSL